MYRAQICRCQSFSTAGSFLNCSKLFRNSGLGKTTAQALAACGAKVILACRNMKKAESARQEIIQATGNQNVICKELDLASFRSVRGFANELYETEDRVDILINNAGLLSKTGNY